LVFWECRAAPGKDLSNRFAPPQNPIPKQKQIRWPHTGAQPFVPALLRSKLTRFAYPKKLLAVQ
jgi:hypothetical protein